MASSFALQFAAASPPGSAPAQLSLIEALLLIVVAGMVVAAFQFRQLLRRLERLEGQLGAAAARAAPAVSPTSSAETRAKSLSPEIVAVVVAAVDATEEQPTQIVSILEDNDTKKVWSLEGRRQIFASHHVR